MNGAPGDSGWGNLEVYPRIALYVCKTYPHLFRCEWIGVVVGICGKEGRWTDEMIESEISTEVIHKLSEAKRQGTDLPVGPDGEGFGAVGGAVVDYFFGFDAVVIIARIPFAISIVVEDGANEIV